MEGRWSPRIRALAVGLALVLGTGAAWVSRRERRPPPAARAVSVEEGFHHHQGTAEADANIARLRAELERFPTSFTAMVLLAQGHFLKAQQVHDARPLKEARELVARSVALQPTYEASLLSARIAAFSHHFAQALTHAEAAQNATPFEGLDPAALAIRVEALLALGQPDAAQALVEQSDSPHFQTAAARYQLARAQRDWPRARAALAQARTEAQRFGAKEMVGWTLVSESRTFLEEGRLAEAEKTLRQAERTDPHSHDGYLAWVELIDRQGDPEAALELCRDLLAHGDAAVAHRAFLLAKKLGRDPQAEEAFRIAERAYRSQLELGEVHTAGALAQLYLDRGDGAQALPLAERNLEFRKDAEAVGLRDKALRLTGRPVAEASAP